MAKFLVHHFLFNPQNAKSTTKFAYFFFADGIAGQDNAAAAASALLHQLYHSRNDLIKQASKRLDRGSDNFFNRFSVLWSIIIETIRDNALNDIVWLLYGMEECEAHSLELMIKAISKLLDDTRPLSEQPLGNCRLKIILLSRPSSIIQNTLGLFAEVETTCSSNKLRLTGENETHALAADIDRFARWKINELSTALALPERVLKRLNKRLIAGADFTFLWISLVLKMVEDSALNGISMADLKRILAANSLDSLYEQLLRRPAREFPSDTRTVLSIILAAVRPLTVDELCVAAEIDTDDVTNNVEEWSNPKRPNSPKNGKLPNHWSTGGDQCTQAPPPTFRVLDERLRRPFDNRIRQLCGHFVRIRCRKVYLVHQTARVFLTSKSFSLGYPRERERFWEPIIPNRATHTLLNICLNYLQIFAQESAHEKLDNWDQDCIDKYLGACRTDPPRAFFPYAALCWVRHYRPIRQKLNGIYDWMLQPGTLNFQSWAKVHWSWTEEHHMTNESSGALWIHGEDERLQRQQDRKMLRKLYTDFRALEEWLYSDWGLHSKSTQLYEEAVNIKARLYENLDFQAVKEYFQQAAILKILKYDRPVKVYPKIAATKNRLEADGNVEECYQQVATVNK